jgi:hypothetical protein
MAELKLGEICANSLVVEILLGYGGSVNRESPVKIA